MFLFKRKEETKVAGTLAVGAGGGGCNIVNRLGKISEVDILTVNTDRKGLVRSRANRRILLGGGSVTDGCGGDVEKGRKMASEASGTIDESIKRHLNIVLMTGLGGGTGTGAAKVIADLARRNGSRVIVMASLPMSFESGRRKTAADALDRIRGKCDILLVMDGDRLIELDPMMGAREAFSVLDQMMCESFMGLMEILEGNDGESMYQSMKGKMFTVSFAEGMDAEKVASALAGGLMMDAAVVSDPIIFVRGNTQGVAEKTISDIISENTGRTPVFVRGPEGRGMNLMMFAPIH
jgi:cell division protein FtsZ